MLFKNLVILKMCIINIYYIYLSPNIKIYISYYLLKIYLYYLSLNINIYCNLLKIYVIVWTRIKCIFLFNKNNNFEYILYLSIYKYKNIYIMLFTKNLLILKIYVINIYYIRIKYMSRIIILNIYYIYLSKNIKIYHVIYQKILSS